MSSIAYEVGSDGKPIIRRFWNMREERYMTVVTAVRPGGMQVVEEVPPQLAPMVQLPQDDVFVPHDTRGPGSGGVPTDVIAPDTEFRGSEQVRGANDEVLAALQGRTYSTDGSHVPPDASVIARVQTEGASADSEAGALADLAVAAGLEPAADPAGL